MHSNITPDQLFQRARVILDSPTNTDIVPNKILHDSLVLICLEALKDSRYGFGDLNTQVETVIRELNIPPNEANSIRQLRRHSNKSHPLTPEDLLYDTAALVTLISRVWRTAVPDDLTTRLPRIQDTQREYLRINTPDKRCTVVSWDEHTIQVIVDEEGMDKEMTVYYAEERQYANMAYLYDLLRTGMQLNLLGCEQREDTLTPRLIVVEPDCLMDISTIAGCFENYGHHPLLYLLNRMKSKPNTQAIILGNYAGGALDDIINDDHTTMEKSLIHNFKEKALEYCTCQDFNGEKFKQDATEQTNNLKKIVEALRHDADLSHAILEPSFVCEKLGVEGRVDLMTSDLKLLVEQKSGRNIFIERPNSYTHGFRVVEKHYVQVLLYYSILFYNFHFKNADIRLLYSKYKLPDGLIKVANLKKLLNEAIRFRNEAVAVEYDMAHHGVEHILTMLKEEVLNTKQMSDHFYENYLRPPLLNVLDPLSAMTPLEHAYFSRMLHFVIRENLMGKVGVSEAMGNSMSQAWSIPLEGKRELGNIYTGLVLTQRSKSDMQNGKDSYDLLTFSVPEQGEDFLPNFRRGDMVYLYAYPQDREPDIRKALLFKGTMADLHSNHIDIKLINGQKNPDIFDILPYDDIMLNNDAQARPEQRFAWCVEQSGSDAGGSASIRSLYEFISSSQDRKDLLLGQRAPRADKSITLTRSYDPDLDPLLLQAKQAQDYFLLVGPPGTGKTSRALRFMVEEQLASTSGAQQSSNKANPDAQEGDILLLSYTNRAVDEICGMLTEAGIDFIRLGNELSCDKAYVPHLISHAIGERPKLNEMQNILRNARVIVSTTSMLQARPFLFSLKHFSLAIIDESSQILEPAIIGLLASHRENTCQNGQLCCDIDKFILIGDHKQLPAVVQQGESEAQVTDPLLQAIGLDSCKNSLFERLIRQEKRSGRTDFIGTLHRQGRMHPSVAEYPGTAFYAEERLVPVPLPHQQQETLAYEAEPLDEMDKQLKHHRVLFVNAQSHDDMTASDKVNAEEARIVADMIRRIRRFYGDHFDPCKTIGVIVPYRKQIAMIRKALDSLNIPDHSNISIDTVERYQGSQRDVIIYSFTIKHRYQLDFLTANTFVENGQPIDRKLNVALTRARQQLILVGNAQILKHDPVFADLIAYIRQNHATIG